MQIAESQHHERQASIKDIVKEKYGQAALRVKSAAAPAAGAPPSTGCCDPITSNLYDAAQAGQIPEEALLASLGCGNPTALAQLNPGETVLDLGSGGGIDVLLSARRVGPTGKAYGLDMTDEMLALASENQRKAGVENVEFLKGEIENIPLPDNSVDVIISNCVINLSADKDRVLREAFRVLKPGGRFAVSDVVTRGDISRRFVADMLLWVGCIAGALEDNDYRGKLAAAGFVHIEIEPTRIYRTEDAREFLSGQGVDMDACTAGGRQVHERLYPRHKTRGLSPRDVRTPHHRRSRWHGTSAGGHRRLRNHGRTPCRGKRGDCFARQYHRDRRYASSTDPDVRPDLRRTFQSSRDPGRCLARRIAVA